MAPCEFWAGGLQPRLKFVTCNTGQLEPACHFPISPVPCMWCSLTWKTWPNIFVNWNSVCPSKSLMLHFFPKASITSLYLKCSLSPTFPEHWHSPCMVFSIKYLQPLNFTDSYIWLTPLVNQKFEIKIAHSFQPFCILVVRLNTAYGLFILGLDYNLMTFW